MAKSQTPAAQSLETLSVLALAALAGGLIFNVHFLLYVALGLLIVGLFIKPLAAWLSRGWLTFARALGTFNSKVILTLIFYMFLTPLAWLYRLFHGDTLRLKPKNPDSYWTVRDHDYTKTDLEKIW